MTPKLALRVKSIAGNLLVREGEVARALLEYALRAYAEGNLDLNPRPHPERMRRTLYPSEQASKHSGHFGARHGKTTRRTEPAWKVITTWRGFSPALKNEIAALASEGGLNVPTGELVTALLCFGLEAFDCGLLKLEPVEEITTLTLFHGAGS